MFQTRIDNLRVRLGLELRFIDPDQFLAAARVFAKTIVGDAIKPGGKTRFAAKAADVFVSAQKNFLSEIVGKGDSGASKLSKQTAHGRLMTSHEFAECMLVIIDKNSCDKIRIG